MISLVPALAGGAEFRTPAITAAQLDAVRGSTQAPLVVDVRPATEYKAGHLPRAVNIPYTKLTRHLDALRAAANGVVLYCTLGKRTQLAEQILLEQRVSKLSHLKGGLGAWRAGGYEIHTGWGP